eukprot:gene19616-49471_t
MRTTLSPWCTLLPLCGAAAAGPLLLTPMIEQGHIRRHRRNCAHTIPVCGPAASVPPASPQGQEAEARERSRVVINGTYG